MKKYFAITLTLVLLFTLAACSKPGNTITQNETVSTSEELPDTVKVMFPEGYSLIQIAQKLEENHVCTADDFVKASFDVDYYKENYGYDFLDTIDRENVAFPLEGFLFPATYDFYTDEDAHSVVHKFLKAFNARFSDSYRQRAQELDMSISEVVALASVIQDECSAVAQMTNVASVFANRIKSPEYQKLQSDVTINYVNNYITNSPYLEGDTSRFAPLYNTYKCTGLPAGPICSPGEDAIYSALNPNETDYYYFVTDSDGNYYYSTTYEQHKENCTKAGIE